MTDSMTNSRFVFFADFLGTKNRYSSPPLVLRSRQLLEQSIDLFFIPILETLDMYLYVFSDTLIVTCPQLIHLLEPISNLFNRFLDFQDNNESRQTDLWLRAAISYGEIIESSHLHNNDRVRTIPFLDTSLPHAYELESIRPGSRVFIDPKIPIESFGEYQRFFLKWQQITGRGDHAPNVGEFLWPAKIQSDNNRLIEKTLELNIRWKELLNKKDWSKKEYHESVIHLDETLKLFIRTCSAFCPKDQRNEILYSFLPQDQESIINVQYEWGIWFQALKGIIDNPNIIESEKQKIKSSFKIIKNILIKDTYFQHFLGELDFPDYTSFKEKFYQIGLDKIEHGSM
jgi:hypothetical protein